MFFFFNFSEAAGLIRHLLTVNPAKRAKMSDILNHWWVNLGYKENPIGEQYPSAEMLNLYLPRSSPILSSDSEGEDQSKPLQPLKGILKKPKTSIDEDQGVPLQPITNDNVSPAVCQEGPNIKCNNSCSNSDNNNSGDDGKKVFDSEKKPARSILKRKGKFSGGDSGCILNESGGKSPSSDTKENNSMLYDLSDIDNVLNIDTGDKSPTDNKEKFSDTVLVTPGENNNTSVVPRRSILKKTSQTDPKKRLSACSTGSNSSADILDFSYDSGDDNYESLSKCPQMSREGSLVGTASFEDLNAEGDLLATMRPKTYEKEDNEFYDTEAASDICNQAFQILKEAQ